MESFHTVQKINTNLDIVYNPENREKYPNLYRAVAAHDSITLSPVYHLSDKAYNEYLEYIGKTK